MRFACVGLLTIVASSFTSRTTAQDLDDVSITGIVSDENAAVIPNAKVVARNTATNTDRETSTDDRGRYRFVELPPGSYSVRVKVAGFATEEKIGLDLVAGRSLQLDFVLRPASVVSEQVVTSATVVSLVDTARTVVGGTLTRAELEDLPIATRSALDLVFTLGGVTEEPLSLRDVAEDRDAGLRGSIERSANTPEEAGNFALAGGPAYSNNLTIDGLDNNDDRGARERFGPPIGAVDELQVITNQFSAEYGRASGGRVNLRTRGGSNVFTGHLFYFFRDEALSANSWNNNRRGLKRLPFQEHVAGFAMGGPLAFSRRFFARRDDGEITKAFFFAAFESRAVLDSALIDALVPVEENPVFPLPPPTTLAGRRFEPEATEPNVPAELAPFVERVSTPAIDQSSSVRIDYNFTDAHNGTFQVQLGRSKNLRQFGGGLRLADALQGRRRNSDAFAYSDNFVFSSSAVNQLRAQISSLRPSFQTQLVSGPAVLITIKDPLASEENEAIVDRSGTLVAGSSSSGATDRREVRLQLQESVTILRGSHSLKIGGDYQAIKSTFIDLTDAAGTYNFTSAGDFLANSPSRFRQRFNTESTLRNRYLGLFLQEEWQLRHNLVLNVGLRYDHETILRDRNNVAPRVGLAYDPFGEGKTVVRLGGGLFFNRVLLRTIDDFTLGRQVTEFDTNALVPAERRAFIAANLRFPQVLQADSPLVGEFSNVITNFSRRLDPQIRIPESYQANAGIERALSASVVVEANYTFNRGLHLWREFNANAPRLPVGFRDFADFLVSRDFANFRNAAGARPVYNSSAAGELVRFRLSSADSSEMISRAFEFGVPVSIFNLNSIGSSTTLDAALAALQQLRPDPTRTQIEQLISVGNGFYHGLTVSARGRLTLGEAGIFFRAAYTLSRLIDDGIVNTSSALRVGDFRGERSRSLLDRRHRFVFSGVFDAPRWLGSLKVATIMRLASGAPFNLSVGGTDRNLDDVSNDRPNFSGDLRLLHYRRPGEAVDPGLFDAFSLPLIGQSGNLGRNAGVGPGLFTFDVNLAREIRFTERVKLRPVVEIGNVLNKTVFTFGAEFINFSALRPNATEDDRRAFEESFLVPQRTLRPRSMRVGLRLDF
jgi:hypothetical protein